MIHPLSSSFVVIAKLLLNNIVLVTVSLPITWMTELSSDFSMAVRIRRQACVRLAPQFALSVPFVASTKMMCCPSKRNDFFVNIHHKFVWGKIDGTIPVLGAVPFNTS